MGYALLLTALIWGSGCSSLGMRGRGAAEARLAAQARSVHAESVLIDAHVDIPYTISEKGVDISRRRQDGHFDFPRAAEGGLDATFFVVFVDNRFNLPGTYPEAVGGAFEESQRLIRLVQEVVAANSAIAELASTPTEVRRIVAAGKHAVILALENGSAIEGDLEKLRTLYQQGIRYITLTHAKDNHLADSSYDDRHTHGGLTEFGRGVVREMNRLGLMVDVSHLSDDGFWDVLETTQAPVIASHSSLRTFRNYERNISDRMLIALRDNGGVVHINFGAYFLSDERENAQGERNRALEAVRQRYGEQKALAEAEISKLEAAYPVVRRVTLQDVVEHIDYAVKLIGVEHVGIGSDYEGVSEVPVGLEDVSCYPRITEELLRRGYSREDLLKINGGNLLRVWEQVIERSTALQASGA